MPEGSQGATCPYDVIGAAIINMKIAKGRKVKAPSPDGKDSAPIRNCGHAAGRPEIIMQSTTRLALLTGAALVATVVATATAQAATTACTVEALTALHVPDVTVQSAHPMPAKDGVPEHCLVDGALTTRGSGAPEGRAGFQLQLPAAWQNRFLFMGVGGNGGSFIPSANAVDRAAALGKGYATAITDTGHQGRNTDASWVVDAAGKRDQARATDFFHRAAHQVTVAGKQLAEAFYAAPIAHAYFDGCSTGGRMAMMEAERYPTDYDGIIAGAPAMDYRSLLGRAAVQKAQFSSPEAYIPATLLPAIDAAIRDACDAADGVKDGMIQNPAHCAWKPETMVCKTAGQGGCLSAAQAATLRTYLSPVRDGTGRTLYPGMSPSDISGPRGIQSWTVGATPPDFKAPLAPWGADPTAPPSGWSYTRDSMAYWLERGPAVAITDFDVDATRAVAGPAAIRAVDAAYAEGVTHDPARLRPFIQQGRKMITYHGFSDPGISPFRTTAFYEAFAKQQGGYPKAQQSVRLFMVPGMAHCSGGPGPDSFDTLTALENWVERHIAPDAIIATATAPGAPKRTMPLCRFPEQAAYRGTGDMNDAANWSCTPNQALLQRSAAR